MLQNIESNYFLIRLKMKKNGNSPANLKDGSYLTALFVSRIENNPAPKPRINDLCDLIGYSVLYLVADGVTKDDILKLID